MMAQRKFEILVPENMSLELDAHLLENEIWLTTEEAMAHLHVSRSTLYRLRKKHDLPNFKLGNIPVYPKHLLNKLLMHLSMRNMKHITFYKKQ